MAIDKIWHPICLFFASSYSQKKNLNLEQRMNVENMRNLRGGELYNLPEVMSLVGETTHQGDTDPDTEGQTSSSQTQAPPASGAMNLMNNGSTKQVLRRSKPLTGIVWRKAGSVCNQGLSLASCVYSTVCNAIHS